MTMTFSNETNRSDASEPALIIISQNPYSWGKNSYNPMICRQALSLAMGLMAFFKMLGLYWVLLGFMAHVLFY
jgi:hypothetical protein